MTKSDTEIKYAETTQGYTKGMCWVQSQGDRIKWVCIKQGGGGWKKYFRKIEQWHNLVYLYLGQIQLIALERILLKVKGEWRKGAQERGGCLSLK